MKNKRRSRIERSRLHNKTPQPTVMSQFTPKTPENVVAVEKKEVVTETPNRYFVRREERPSITELNAQIEELMKER